jgi:hypothetical protein
MALVRSRVVVALGNIKDDAAVATKVNSIAKETAHIALASALQSLGRSPERQPLRRLPRIHLTVFFATRLFAFSTLAMTAVLLLLEWSAVETRRIPHRCNLQPGPPQKDNKEIPTDYPFSGTSSPHCM